jgi:hypothetical protein
VEAREAEQRPHDAVREADQVQQQSAERPAPDRRRLRILGLVLLVLLVDVDVYVVVLLLVVIAAEGELVVAVAAIADAVGPVDGEGHAPRAATATRRHGRGRGRSRRLLRRAALLGYPLAVGLAHGAAEDARLAPVLLVQHALVEAEAPAHERVAALRRAREAHHGHEHVE